MAELDVILIDGRSGSGKTELARALGALRPEYQVLHLDGIYPGWDGLDAASAAVPGILERRHWRSWDWAHDRPGGLHALDPDRPVIIEGAGALSRASRPLARLAVWVELDEIARKRRALDRDGYFAEHWDRWAVHEAAFIAREDPQGLADVVMQGPDAAERATSLLL